MAVDARQDRATRAGAYRRVGEQLVIHPETLRTWVSCCSGVSVTGLPCKSVVICARGEKVTVVGHGFEDPGRGRDVLG